MAKDQAATAPEAAPGALPNVSRDELLTFYREMLLIRRFEEKAGQLYGMGLIGGFCHLYIGQEAVVVGLEAAPRKATSASRATATTGHMLACGMDAKGVMAELTGREGGYSKGKGGSMHMFSKERHFYGGHGIVAAQVPIGAGLGLRDKYLGNGRVTFTYFGDGAANQGQVYETYNMAQLWQLPVIFVIENNQYAMGTSVKRSTMSRTYWERGAAYGIAGEEVDGMDVLAVKAAGRARRRPLPLRRRPLHPRGQDLPLPRPLDVGPGQVPHARGGPEDEGRARPDRARPLHAPDRQPRDRGRPQGHRPRDQGHRERVRRVLQGKPGARPVRALDRHRRLT
jgi:TPP-dependent pyruvate/acetoin dehydrogenase alpha subunit